MTLRQYFLWCLPVSLRRWVFNRRSLGSLRILSDPSEVKLRLSVLSPQDVDNYLLRNRLRIYSSEDQVSIITCHGDGVRAERIGDEIKLVVQEDETCVFIVLSDQEARALAVILNSIGNSCKR